MLCFVHGGCEPISALLLPITGPISSSMPSSVRSEVTHLSPKHCIAHITFRRCLIPKYGISTRSPLTVDAERDANSHCSQLALGGEIIEILRTENVGLLDLPRFLKYFFLLQIYEIELCHWTWYCTFGSFAFLPQGPLEVQSTRLNRNGISQIIMYTTSMRLYRPMT
jgi:hypothetical protein